MLSYSIQRKPSCFYRAFNQRKPSNPPKSIRAEYSKLLVVAIYHWYSKVEFFTTPQAPSQIKITNTYAIVKKKKKKKWITLFLSQKCVNTLCESSGRLFGIRRRPANFCTLVFVGYLPVGYYGVPYSANKTNTTSTKRVLEIVNVNCCFLFSAIVMEYHSTIHCNVVLQACRVDPIYCDIFGPATDSQIYGPPIDLWYNHKRVPALACTHSLLGGQAWISIRMENRKKANRKERVFKDTVNLTRANLVHLVQSLWYLKLRIARRSIKIKIK